MSIVRTVSRTKNFQQEASKTTLLVGTPKSRNSLRKIPLPNFLLHLADNLRMGAEDESTYILSGSDVPMDQEPTEVI